MADADYICWVQRALNLALPENTRIDGQDTPLYRSRVRTFNDSYLFGKRPVGRQDVDELVQNELIRTNHANAAFRHWACIAMGDPTPRNGPAFRKAVAAWQAAHKVVPSDGWVGSRTEKRLMGFARRPHPGHLVGGNNPIPWPVPDIPDDDDADDVVARALNRLPPAERMVAMAGRARRTYRSIGTYEYHDRLCGVILRSPLFWLVRPHWYFIDENIRWISESKDPIWRDFNGTLRREGYPAIVRRMEAHPFMTDGNSHLNKGVIGDWSTAGKLQAADKQFRNAINQIVTGIERGIWRMGHEITLSGSVKPSDRTFYTTVPSRMEFLHKDNLNFYSAFDLEKAEGWGKIARMEWPHQ